MYTQIISDLKDAQSVLPGDYNVSSGEKIRPNKWVATALLARVYLYQKDWVDAKSQATTVINNTGLFSLDPDLNSVFLANSSDAIWQLMPVQPGFNTQEGETFILTAAPQNLSITPSLLGAFENGDNRKTDWIDSIIVGGQTYYFPFKYKIQYSNTLSEYSMVLRLSEQYLDPGRSRIPIKRFPGCDSDVTSISFAPGPVCPRQLPLINQVYWRP